MADKLEAYLKTTLFQLVSRRLVGEGFSLNQPRGTFVRSRDGVTDMFMLVCLDGKPGWRIQPNVGVRVERIEQIFHQTSGFEPQYQGGTATVGASVGELLASSSRACEFRLETEDELASTVDDVERVFHEFALPFFERWSSLQAIDAELNTNPLMRTPLRSVAYFRCATGIIVARLLGRPDYEQLAALYTDVMTGDNKGFYLGRFQALLESLLHVQPGSGMIESR